MGVNVLIICLICLLPENPPGWIKSYFPDFTMVFLKEFEGKFEDIDIAHKTGEMVIACRTSDGEGIVYYLDKEGILKWFLKGREMTDIKRIGMIDVEISDNGENVYIFWSGDWEYTREQVYDRKGRLLFDAKGGMEPVVSLFPSGGFTYSDKIYDKNGKEIDFSPPFKEYKPRYRVISDSEIVVMGTEEIFVTRKQLSEYFEKGKVPFRKEVVYLVSFPDGKVKMKMDVKKKERNKISGLWRIGDKILVRYFTPLYKGGFRDKFLTCCYNNNGKLLWKKRGDYYYSKQVEYVSPNEKIYACLRGSEFLLINYDTGEIIMRKNLHKEGFYVGRVYSFFTLQDPKGFLLIFISHQKNKDTSPITYVFSLSKEKRLELKEIKNGVFLKYGKYKHFLVLLGDENKWELHVLYKEEK